MENQEEIELSEAIHKVSKEWPLSAFKKFIQEFLLTTNNEDQWTWDYESYALSCRHCKRKDIMHPKYWAPEHYQERWDQKKIKAKYGDVYDNN